MHTHTGTIILYKELTVNICYTSLYVNKKGMPA